MIYLSMIISFLILLCVVVVGIQNNTPMQIKLAWWVLQVSLTDVVFWAAASGAVVVLVLSFPKLVGKTLQTRRLLKELERLEALRKETGQQETV